MPPVVPPLPLPKSVPQLRAALAPIFQRPPNLPATTPHLFALIRISNMQYKVSVGDVIAVQRLRCDIGSQIAIKKVMMVGSPRFTAVGRPFLEHCRLIADVEEQKRMRPVLHVRALRAHRRTQWKDNYHPATILRIREMAYEPLVVGELHKYQGNLIALPGDDVVEGPVAALPGAADPHYPDEFEGGSDWVSVAPSSSSSSATTPVATASSNGRSGSSWTLENDSPNRQLHWLDSSDSVRGHTVSMVGGSFQTQKGQI